MAKKNYRNRALRRRTSQLALASMQTLESRTYFGAQWNNTDSIVWPLNCSTCDASSAPVIYETGTPIIGGSDLESKAFGRPWGYTRDWVGANNASQNGNGWMIKELPYLSVLMNQWAGAHGGTIEVVRGVQSVAQFDVDVNSTTYVGRGKVQDKLEYVPCTTQNGKKLPGYFKLTDTAGNITTFYDLPRSGYQTGRWLTDPNYGTSYGTVWGQMGYPNMVTRQWFDGDSDTDARAESATDAYRFGAFRSYTDASGKYTVTAQYDPVTGDLRDMVRTDGSGKYERLHFSYQDYTYRDTTHDIATTTRLVSEVALQQAVDANGPWGTTQFSQYQYYDGTDSNGRLGDLKRVTVSKPTSQRVASLTRSGTTVTATISGNAYQVGDLITIQGASINAYNGTFAVTYSQGSTVRYTALTTPSASNPSGIILASKPQQISTLTHTGATATATIPGHNYSAGDLITIRGASPDIYNGTFKVATVNGNSLTFNLTATPLSNAAAGLVATSQQAVSSITHYGTTATVTLPGHKYRQGDLITIRGATPAIYNGTFSVASVDYLAGTLTYTLPSDPIDHASVAGDIIVANMEQTVSSITRSGTTATATISNHQYVQGDRITITGASPKLDQYNGTFTVASVNGNTLTFTLASTPSDQASGLMYCEARQAIDQEYYRYYKFHSYNFYAQSGTNHGRVADFHALASGDYDRSGGGDITFGVGEDPATQVKDNAVMSGLKTVVKGAAFARLRASYPQFESLSDVDCDPATDANGDSDATNDQVKAYSDNFFKYDRFDGRTFVNHAWNVTAAPIYRVRQETASKGGCSNRCGGFGTSKFEVAANSQWKADPYSLYTGVPTVYANKWVTKTTEYLPDATNPLASTTCDATSVTEVTVQWSGAGSLSVGDAVVVTDDLDGYDGSYSITSVQVSSFTIAVPGGWTRNTSTATVEVTHDPFGTPSVVTRNDVTMTAGAVEVIVNWANNASVGDQIWIAASSPSIFDGLYTVSSIDADGNPHALHASVSMPVSVAGATVTNYDRVASTAWSDNDREITYANSLGNVMLKVVVDGKGTSTQSDDKVLSIVYNRYDDEGRQEYVVHSSALASYNPSNPGGWEYISIPGQIGDQAYTSDLVGWGLSNSKVFSDKGLIEHYQYANASSSAISSSTSGAARGQLQSYSVRQGYNGTDTTIYSQDYYRHDETVYRALGENELTGQTQGSDFVATVVWPGHGLSVGDQIVITGADQPQYNNTFAITAVTDGTFSFKLASSAASPATGSIVVAATGQRSLQSGDLWGVSTEVWVPWINSGFTVGQVVTLTGTSPFNGNATVNAVGVNGFSVRLSAPTTTSPSGSLTIGTTGFTRTYASGVWSARTVARIAAPNTRYVKGDEIRITGATPSEYAGVFTIIKSDSSANGWIEFALGSVASTLNPSGSNVTVTDLSLAGATFPLASRTSYQDTGVQPTTTYDYTWRDDDRGFETNRIESKTVHLPAVTLNGSGSSNESISVLDAAGRTIWRKDEKGYLTYSEYDPHSGVVTKRIVDVDTVGHASDFTGLPSGWATPSGGGLHLMTLRGVDDQGRTTKLTDPKGNVTYTVYNDAAHEVRTYPGWNSTAHTTTGPIQVTRTYWPSAGAAAGQRTAYTDRLTSIAQPSYDAATGVPTGTETINTGNVTSLTRTITNDAGQVTKSDRYFSMPAVAAPSIGATGFEAPALSPGSYQYNPTGGSWTFASNAGISSNGSAWGHPAAPDGSQVAFLQTLQSSPGSISQTISGWSAGNYSISFKSAQRSGYSGQVFDVKVDGNVVATISPTSTSFATYSTPSFALTAGSHTITFQAQVPGSGDYGAFLDSIAVSAGMSLDSQLELGTASNNSSTGNFHRTLTDYDGRGRVKRVESPSGTITRTRYDARGLVTSTWIGTDDTPDSGSWSPTNTAGTNMVKVSENQYDFGFRGDGNVTMAAAYPGGGADPRVTYSAYDYRNRLVWQKAGAQTDESDGVHRPITYYTYDNADHVTATETFDGDEVVTAPVIWQLPQLQNGDFEDGWTPWTGTGGAYGGIYDGSDFGASSDILVLEAHDGLTTDVRQELELGIGTYTVEFDTQLPSTWPTGWEYSYDAATVQVLFDGQPVGSPFTPGTTTSHHSVNVSAATSGTHTIGFAVGNADYYAHICWVDNVEISSLGGAVDANNDGVPDKPSATLLRAKATTSYDELGRVYSSQTYSVNQSNGNLIGALETLTWYDSRGNVIKTSAPGGLVTKTAYDGAARQTKVYQTYGGGDSGYADADNVVGDIVLEQIEYRYDADGNVIFTSTKQRNHDATSTGALPDPASGSSIYQSVPGQTSATYSSVLSGVVPTSGAGLNISNWASDDLAVLIGENESITVTDNGTSWTVTLPDDAILFRDTTGYWGLGSWGWGEPITIRNASGTRQHTMTQIYDNHIIDFETGDSGYSGFQTRAGNSGVTADELRSRGWVDANNVARVKFGGVGDAGFFSADVAFAGGGGARVSYTESYYDAANRLTDTVNLGTNGGNGKQDPDATPPARSDAVLRTSYSYDNYESGVRYDTKTDPKGKVGRTYYDLLGRTTKTIANYVNGSPSSADDQTTEYTYNGAGNVLTMTARLPSSAFQTTQYVYGMENAVSITRGGSGNLTATVTLANHGLKSGQWVTIFDAAEEQYNGTFQITWLSSSTFSYLMNSAPTQNATGTPTMRMGDDAYNNDPLSAVRYPDKSTGSASAAEQETFTYNALGQRKSYGDRNGNVHSYSYDVLGRMTSDAVTTLGSANGAVRRIEYSYNALGLPYEITSYNAASGGTVTSRLRREYNGLGQLATEYQAHDATPISGSTPHVSYAYSETESGTVNHSRLTSITYPNGRVISYNYDGSTLDDAISRLTSISDADGSLESYSYLGLGTVVQRTQGDGVSLTYIKQSGEAVGDAGDQYTGLDRFGRVVDQRWIDSGGTAIDRYQYTYDRNGNVLTKTNVLYTANNETYGYDDLNRLTSLGGGTNKTWTLDATGNWTNVTGESGNRVINSQNQVTTVNGSSATYDANGNTVTDGFGHTYTYDAWNRLKTGTNGTGTETFGYDGTGRKITTAVSGGSTTDHYYSDQWQVLEDQTSGVTKAQYVWSPVYVYALILQDRDADNNSGTGNLGQTGSGLEERMYATQDANYNVMALVDGTPGSGTLGQAKERYKYDPYGAVTFLNPTTWVSIGASAYGAVFLYQGGRFDGVTGTVEFENRETNVALGRWLQPDPIGYPEGMNRYQWELSNALALLDPDGLKSETVDYLKEETIKAGMEMVKASQGKLAALAHLLDGTKALNKAVTTTAKTALALKDVWSVISSSDSGARTKTWNSLVEEFTKEGVKTVIKFVADAAGASSFLGGLYAAVAVDAVEFGSALGESLASSALRELTINTINQAGTDPELKPGTLEFYNKYSATDCGLYVFKDHERTGIWAQVPVVKSAWEFFAEQEYEWVKFDLN
jgi:RHS repeat-associated protein